MSARVRIFGLGSLAALAVVLLIAAQHTPSRGQGSAIRPRPPAAAVRRAPATAAQARHRVPPGQPTSGDPRATAAAFLTGWLACTYHQGSCDSLSGALPAYTAALAGRTGSSRATPAEKAARPHVTSLDETRNCADSAIVTAVYQDGQGGHFQIHLNLVREPTGWQVFDVAEAPPHIPLPPPLSRGPRAC